MGGIPVIGEGTPVPDWVGIGGYPSPRQGVVPQSQYGYPHLTRTGLGYPPVRTGVGYPSCTSKPWPGLGYPLPPEIGYGSSGDAEGGTPLVVSHRRTALLS